MVLCLRAVVASLLFAYTLLRLTEIVDSSSQNASMSSTFEPVTLYHHSTCQPVIAVCVCFVSKGPLKIV